MKSAEQTLGNYRQVIPSELKAALEEAAEARRISLEIEIALRLTAYLTESDFSKDNSLYSQIVRKEFTEAEAVSECKRKRLATLYIYEMEKLRLFLRFENSLPRNIKESFMVIDLKKATKIIKAELENEEKRNNQGE